MYTLALSVYLYISNIPTRKSNTLIILQEEHHGLLQYIIPKAYNVTWAAIFSLLERHKDQIGIQVNICCVKLCAILFLRGKENDCYTRS